MPANAALHFFRLMVVLSAACSVHALDPRKAITQYQQDFWTQEDGLPQASVQAITQTRNGYLWIGTRDGLARFDGTKFTVYRGDEYSGLLSDDIRSLYEDKSGRLWIGTFNRGLTCYENGTFQSIATRDGLTSAGVLEIYEDSNSTLWFGAWSGVLKYAGGKLETFQAPQGLAGKSVWSIWEDPQRNLLVSTTAGVQVYKDGRFQPQPQWRGVRSRDIRQVYTDRRGVTWVATLEGLVRSDAHSTRILTAADGLPDARARCLVEDAQDNLWIGTWNGICRIQGEQITSVPKLSGERLNGLIEALFVDRDGSLWVGIRGGGLARLRDARFSNLTEREGLPSHLPRCVFPASDGTVWIGTDGGGLARVEGDKIQKLGKAEGLPSEHVASLAESRDGAIWAGLSRPAAIAEIRHGRVTKTIRAQDGLTSETSIRCLFADKDGTLWAGGDGGLCQIANGQIRPVSGIPETPVRVIAQDVEGRLWAGSEGGLCLVKDGKVAAVHTVRDGLSHNAIYSFFEDREGVIWIGAQQGLTRFAKGKFETVTRARGGFQGTIYQVLEDDDQTIWTLSSRGISAMRKRDIESVIEGRLSSLEPITFGTADGLKSSQGQGGSQGPGCKTPDGRLWFATLNGVAIVSPREPDPHREPPPVLIEELWANRKPFQPLAKNNFPADTDDFEFHYTAIQFITPERTQFRYRLVGHDKEWVPAKSRRAAYYSNLRPGSFTFQVSASNDGIVWSKPVQTGAFILQPHFYQTVWFYLLALLSIAAAAWAFHQRRLIRAQEQFAAVLAERTRIARDLHDTLAQGFAGAAFQLEALRTGLTDAPPEIKRHLTLALTMVRHSFTEAKRAVLNLRSPIIEAEGLEPAVRDIGDQILRDTGIKMTTRIEGKHRRFGSEIEHQLLRICQEAIANAVKHSHCTEIEVVFDYSGKKPILSIRDNGSGFDVREAGQCNVHHFGIQGMTERMKQMGGELEIRSAPGQGSEVLIRLD